MPMGSPIYTRYVVSKFVLSAMIYLIWYYLKRGTRMETKGMSTILYLTRMQGDVSER